MIHIECSVFHNPEPDGIVPGYKTQNRVSYPFSGNGDPHNPKDIYLHILLFARDCSIAYPNIKIIL